MQPDAPHELDSEALPARRGRPRRPDVDRRIKRAALETLASSGFGGVTVDAICLRAGVARSTFYRRWPTAIAVLLDAFDEAARLKELPETGTLLEDLVAYAKNVVALFGDPVFGACMAFLSAEARLSPPMRQRLLSDLARRRDFNRRLFQRAAARGERAPAIDPDLLLDVFNGLALTYGATGKPPRDEDLALVISRLLGSGEGPRA